MVEHERDIPRSIVRVVVKMKGFAHFLAGLTTATFIVVMANIYYGNNIIADEIVRHKALIIILGGIFGILPDMIDFRFAKYLQRHDYEVDMDEWNLNPHLVVDTLAKAIDQAHDEKREVNVMLHTIKISSDQWRQYTVRFDTKNKKVICDIGPIISGFEKRPYINTYLPEEKSHAEASFKADLKYNYDEVTHVDILSGPDFSFFPEKDGSVRADFIPWHRRWSHSITMGILFAPIGFMLYGFTPLGWTAFWIIMLGYWSHILTDHFGLMGSNMFPPFTKKRVPGFGITRSMSTLANVFTNYTNSLLVIFNMNAWSRVHYFEMPWTSYLGITSNDYLSWYVISLLNYIVYYILPPILVAYFTVLYYRKKRGMVEMSDREARTREQMEETGEISA